ncbi:hypothetical protein ECA727_16070, partial [Escherichia coli ECA-727]
GGLAQALLKYKAFLIEQQCGYYGIFRLSARV